MQEEEKTSFHERAKELKTRSNKTLKQIADACGISESMVSRYLSGSAVPPEDIARKILEYLKENTVQIVPEEDEDMQAAIEMLKTVYESRIADLWKTISSLKRDKITLFVSLCVIIIVVIYLLLDGTHGNWGLFQPRG